MTIGSLKPQDVVVMLKIHCDVGQGWTFLSLAQQLGMSASEVHGALGRAGYAQLYSRARRQVRVHNLLEFLEHGVRYAFAVQPGTLTRGVVTAWSAPPLDAQVAGGGGPPLVWPDPRGTVEGLLVQPLYRSVPQAVRQDPALHALLALVDALRLGRSRERTLAMAALSERLRAAPAPAAPTAPEVPPLAQQLGERVMALRAQPGQSLYESRPLQDIIALLDREAGVAAAVSAAGAGLRVLIAAWAAGLLSDPEHVALLEEHLPRGPAQDARLELALSRLQDLAALQAEPPRRI